MAIWTYKAPSGQLIITDQFKGYIAFKSSGENKWFKIKIEGGSGGSVEWGDITGSLANQKDLWSLISQIQTAIKSTDTMVQTINQEITTLIVWQASVNHDINYLTDWQLKANSDITNLSQWQIDADADKKNFANKDLSNLTPLGQERFLSPYQVDDISIKVNLDNNLQVITQTPTSSTNKIATMADLNAQIEALKKIMDKLIKNSI